MPTPNTWGADQPHYLGRKLKGDANPDYLGRKVAKMPSPLPGEEEGQCHEAALPRRPIGCRKSCPKLGTKQMLREGAELNFYRPMPNGGIDLTAMIAQGKIH